MSLEKKYNTFINTWHKTEKVSSFRVIVRVLVAKKVFKRPM